MGNSRPFVCNLFIVNDAVAIIRFIQFVIRRAKRVFGERFACFRFRVRDLLELRKLFVLGSTLFSMSTSTMYVTTLEAMVPCHAR